MAERTFSEEQIQALLRRATQLHLQDEGEKAGLSLKDLEHIAADAGIPPQYLRAALHEADHQVSGRDNTGFTNTHVFVERVVPGELTDQEWEAVVLRLRKAYANDMAESYGMGPQYGRGVTETLGSTREWRHTTSMGVVTTLTIRSAEGKQFVNFQRRVGLGSPRAEGLGYGFILALFVALMAGAAASSVWALIGVLAALWAVATPVIERLDRGWRQRKLAEMKDIADDIADLVRSEVPEAATASDQAATPAPILNLDEADEVASGPYQQRDRTQA